jgi:hypothetical protein
MDREYGTHEAEEKCIQCLVDKPEERGRLGKSRHTWKDNIKIGLNKTEMEVVDCFARLMIVTRGRVL